MNKLKIFMFVAALAFAAYGCRKPIEVSFVNDTFEIGAQGGVLEANLESNGAWSICGTPDWITVSPESGTGNTTLTLTVLPNDESEIRIGKIDASSKDNSAMITVTQEAKSETEYLRVSPDGLQCDRWGDSLEINVESNLEWQLTGLPNWITASVTNGSGNGHILIVVAPIEDEISEGRQAMLTVVGGDLEETVFINQLSESSHVFSVNPMELEFSCLSGTGTFSVTSTMPWTASAEADLITFAPSSGDGDAEVTVNIAENTEHTNRKVSIQFEYAFPGGVIGSTVVWLRQEGAPDLHFLEVSPLDIVFGKEGGTREITIGCDTEWKVDLVSDWLSVSEMVGTGDATILLIAEPNSYVEPRSEECFISSDGLEKRLMVTQEPADQVMVATFVPDTVFASYTGGVYHLDLTSNVDWQLQSSDWIGLMSVSSGEGDAPIDIVVDFNSSELDRTGYVKALHDGRVLSSAVVVQEGKLNILETDITEIEARPEGGEYVIHVTANQAWQVAYNVSWLSCAPESGFGNGNITITVDPLPSVRPRIGQLKLKGSSGTELLIAVNQHQ